MTAFPGCTFMTDEDGYIGFLVGAGAASEDTAREAMRATAREFEYDLPQDLAISLHPFREPRPDEDGADDNVLMRCPRDEATQMVWVTDEDINEYIVSGLPFSPAEAQRSHSEGGEHVG